MTGYGKAEAQLEGGRLTVEIRALNGKTADISVKSSLLPKDKDLQVRKMISDRLQRGTIDVYVNFEAAADGNARQIPVALVQNYLEQLRPVAGGRSETVDAALLGAILRFPDVTDTKKADVVTEDNWPLVEKAFAECLDRLDAYRMTEGAALEKEDRKSTRLNSSH